MSEALPGMPPVPPPAPPKDASAVVLYRRAPDGVQVFWLEREARLRFAGGFFAFPGGAVDGSDAHVPIAGLEGAHPHRFVAAAARELFEETGVLLARGAERVDQATRDELRRELLAGRLSFQALLAAQGLTVHADDFTAAGRWVTPPYLSRGFDARFFLVEAPAGAHAEVWKGELAAGDWISPREALSRWTAGTALLHPPNLHALQVMARFTDAATATTLLVAPSANTAFVADRIEFQRGVLLFPQRTPTLPPATHTNCYLLGTRELLLVDPGSDDPGEVEALLRFVRGLAPEGFVVKAVVLTHHHGDHVGGARAMAEALGVPVWAHARTADRLEVPVARLLHDGEVLHLDGPLPMDWRVLHTPGHARGHVTLVDEVSRAAVLGDMVSGVGTIVIDPPEGDMGEYLRQLERLERLGVRTLYPAHGPVIPDGPAKLREYAAHRAWREGKVVAALEHLGRPAELGELVPLAYDDVAAFAWPIAERTTAAILAKLVDEGRCVRAGPKVCLSA